MRIIIVEGPAGAGKSTWIEERVKEGHNGLVGYVSSSLEDYTGSRFPLDYDDTLGLAMMNDVRKYHGALNLLYGPENYEVVYIDRLVYSQAIYGAIRWGLEPTEPNVQRLLEQAYTALTSMTPFVNASLQGTMPSLEVMINPKIMVNFIVPTWEQLQVQRGNAQVERGREYPTGKLDWDWYQAVQERMATYFEGVVEA